MPPYHRMDVAITLDENLRRKRTWKGSWTFSVYNLYGRKNPYSVFTVRMPPFKAWIKIKHSTPSINCQSLAFRFLQSPTILNSDAEKTIYILVISVFFISCEELYFPSMKDAGGVLMVDALVTNNLSQSYVRLTRSTSFTM